jgi:Na+/melibiose symporter-like transporter
MNFPVNYQIVFMGLSLGGLISYYFSSHIDLPETHVTLATSGVSYRQRFRSYFKTILAEKPFVSFTTKRFVYLTGQVLAVPIFPLYYVRVVKANDAWIGIINTASTAVLVLGYFFWTRQSRTRGSRFVLLYSTLGMAIYPALIASTQNLHAIVLLAGIAGIFQSGIDLVFFDELMKTVPEEFSAMFVSWAQGIQYLSSFAAPLIGTFLANYIGLGGALLVSAGIRLLAFGLFAVGDRVRVPALVNLSEE